MSINIIYTIIAGIFGACIGSFLNVCIDRLPAGGSLIKPASHCDGCHRNLTAIEMIPVFSYLFLRGKCRVCQMKVPRRVLWVELGTAILLAFLYYKFSWSFNFVIISAYCCLFIVLMVIDLEHRLILNKIVYPSVLVVIIINLIFSQPKITNSLIGGVIGFVLLAIPAIVTRGGMGWGDVKMAGLIGLMVGFPQIFVGILMAIILGGLVGIALLVSRKKKRNEGIPFGPYLSIGAMITLLWGSQIISWYLGRF